MHLTSQVVRTLFTLPFRDTTIVWGNSATSTHYAYPKTSHQLEGFVYSIQNSKLTRIPLDGFGLVADAGAGIITFGRNENQIHTSYYYDKAANQRYSAGLILLPEKCAFSTKVTGLLWCANYTGTLDLEFPDNWYSGDTTSRDSLFAINLTPDAIATTNLVDTFAETSREIDSTQMTIGDNERNLYFINKNDNTLWMYDLSS